MSSFFVSGLFALVLSASSALHLVPSTVPPRLVGELGALIDQLSVSPERSAGYKRSLFPHWDMQENGCTTREVVLIAESETPAVVARSCAVRSGLWVSPYDGKVLTDPRGLDVDHVVALKEAWDSGAHAWTAARRRAFANDVSHPDSLVAVSAASNRSKSDKDPAQWLPQRSDQCRYALTWVGVKLRWGLSADVKEVAALRTLAARCDQR
jgi:hypothetical protein